MKFFLNLPQHRQGIIAILLGAVLWSTAGLFIKLLPFDAFTILFYRSTLAAGLFGLLYGGKGLRMNAQGWLNSVFYCLLLCSFVVSTKLTTAANSIFLQYTAPVYVLLAEPVLFKTKMLRINSATILVCTAGMVLLVWGDVQAGNFWGNLIAFGSGLLLAALILGQRLNHPDQQVRSIFWGNILVALIGLPFFLQSEIPSPPQAAMLAFLGLFQIGLGYVFFTYGLKRVTATEGALLAMLEPILNPVWVFLGHGEKPSENALLGGLVILLALAARIFWLEKNKVDRA